VYWTGFSTGVVGRLDRSTGTSEIIAETGEGTNPIAFGPDGQLLVGRAFTGNGLLEVDPAGVEAPRTITEDSKSINAFTVADDGFVYGPAATIIVQIDLTTGATATIAEGFGFASAVRFHSGDDKLYVLDAFPPSLHRIDLDGANREMVATLSDVGATDNFVISPEGTFYISRLNAPVITRVSADGSENEDFAIGQ
jgi:sugar lactone lactonase YvrE